MQKSGGFSLRAMLQTGFRPEEIFPLYAPGALRAAATHSIDQYRLFFGHFSYDEVLAVNPPVVATMLRDPVARILSLYWFWRTFTDAYAETSGDFGVQFARSVDLVTFFTHAPLGIRANYENAMVRQIVGAPYCLPHVGFTLPEAEILDIAKEHISSMAVCGIMERFGDSARLLARSFGLPKTPETVRANTFESRASKLDGERLVREAPSPILLRRLHAMTELDRELYDYAERLLRERLAKEAA